MTRRLSPKALQEILDNPKLWMAICDALDIKPVSLPKVVERNSHRLNSHDIVLLVASAMEVSPDEILIDDANVGEVQNSKFTPKNAVA